MTTNMIKCPPVWTNDMSYDDFKKELQVWQLLKSATAQQEGPLVFGTLTGKAKRACKQLSLEDIGSDTGLQKILDKLDEEYNANKDQKIFVELDSFEKFKRPSSMTMSAFLLEFERLHTSVKHYKCEYPDGVLAYKVLKAANINYESEKLCKATIVGNWTYKSMKDQLKKIFVDITAVPSDCHDKPIKLEQTLYGSNIDNEDQFQSEDEDNDDCDDVGCSRCDKPVQDHNTYFGRYQPVRGGQKKSYGGNFQYNHYQQRFKNRNNQPQQPSSNRKYIDINLQKLKDSYDSNPNVLNPKDSRGNHTTCRKCRSIYHWYQDCPHNNSTPEGPSPGSKVYFGNDTTEDQVYISLFQSSVPVTTNEVLCLVGETLNHAVIDSGCTKTVCGQKWFTAYCDTMTDDQRFHLEQNSKESSAIFRFGDSSPIGSQKLVHLPVTIKNKNIYLPTEVVEADIPLLVSKQTLEDGKAILDCGGRTISIYGVKQPLIITSSGHHAIPIKPHSQDLPANIVMHSITEDLDVVAVSKKLHQQFGHPSAERLKRLIKDAGEDNDDLLKTIEEVTNKCDTCKRYKIAPPKPAVTFPLATIFNQTLAMDLKVFKNHQIYFLHIIDHATRFSVASVIYTKKSDTIITNFFNKWISVFGSPMRILSDNGGEFVNKQFLDMCDNLSIEYSTTAAEAHWSNGLVEKHNDMIGVTVHKIIEDVNCSVEIALAWAVNAKNSLQNIHGFSSYQLVFGRNPNLPTVCSSNLPALEGVTESKIIADQLNALHSARQQFIKSESSEKLRRALRSKTRTHNNIRYLQGEKVFYKDEDQKRWKGSAVVIGQDGSKVLLKIPTGLKSVHSSRVILTSDAEIDRQNSETTDKEQEPSIDPGLPNTEITDKKNVDIPEDNPHPQNNDNIEEYDRSIRNFMDNLDTTEAQNKFVQIPAAHNNATPQPDVVGDQQPNNSTTNDNADDTHNDDAITHDQQNDTTHEHDQSNDGILTSQNLSHPRDLPKNHQCIQYKLKDSDDWKHCLVLGKAGKATGNNRFYLNIRNLQDNVERCVDWKNNVSEWKVIQENFPVFLASNNNPDYAEAKQAELEKWKQMNAYEVVDNIGQRYVSVRWVLGEKEKDGDIEKRARLVARGYEDDLEGAPTDSPTVNKESLRVAFSVIASMGWEINSLDIKAAFLQGKPMTREVYIKPPKEAKMKGKLWRMKQCVYGLNDASRNFYLTIKETLIDLGCSCSRLDRSIFTYHQDGLLLGLLMCHVDDFLWASTESFRETVVNKLRTIFTISSENSTLFKYLGIEIQQFDKGIVINLNNYTKEIEEIQIDSKRLANPDQPLNEAEVTTLRSTIGSLTWLSTQSRPDLAYDVCHLSTSLKDGTVNLLSQANKVIAKAKSENVYLSFPRMDLEDLSIFCYADASCGNLRDGGSQMGSVIELRSGDKSCVIDWFSKRIRRCAKSTMAAETIAMVDAVDNAIYLSELLSEIIYNRTKKIPVHAFTDNKSLFQSAQSTTAIQDRRLRIEMAIMRECVEKEDITLSWIESENQLADCLTKKGCDSRKLLARILNMTL